LDRRGKLRYVIRDLPLDLHAHARGAALAARCAGEQGRFWEMRNQLFSNQNRLAQGDLAEHARTLGLDDQIFNACLENERFTQEIDREWLMPKQSGLEGHRPSSLAGLPEMRSRESSWSALNPIRSSTPS